MSTVTGQMLEGRSGGFCTVVRSLPPNPEVIASIPGLVEGRIFG